MLTGRTRLVGLVGNPVSHSLSPRMQNAAFAARGLDWTYVALPVEEGRLEAAVRGLAALGFAGANVTAPYKAAVASLCDRLDEPAARAGSVNTLVVADGAVEGATTDADVLEDVEARSAAIVGAGGAAAAFAAAAVLLLVGRRRVAVAVAAVATAAIAVWGYLFAGFVDDVFEAAAIAAAAPAGFALLAFSASRR